jgi:hypothetical protein
MKSHVVAQIACVEFGTRYVTMDLVRGRGVGGWWVQ